jgi:hypothetical protein
MWSGMGTWATVLLTRAEVMFGCVYKQVPFKKLWSVRRVNGVHQMKAVRVSCR